MTRTQVSSSFVFLVACALGACTRDEPAPPVAATPAPAPVSTLAPAPEPPPEPRPLPPDATSLAPEDRDYLIGQGLGEPEADLIADLRTHPELIKCKASQGGTFGFHDPEAIRILGRDRAQAGFDDGHTAGIVDLTFTVKRGTIQWKVDKTECEGGARVAGAGSS
jgi:hypothetical protein